MMMGGVSLLVLGVIFLLKDLGTWDFWGISWWTALFVVVGVGQIGSSKCPNCEAVRTGRMSKK